MQVLLAIITLLEKLLKSVNSLKSEIIDPLDIVPDVHTLTLGPLNGTFQSKRDFADVVRLSLEMEITLECQGCSEVPRTVLIKGRQRDPVQKKEGGTGAEAGAMCFPREDGHQQRIHGFWKLGGRTDASWEPPGTARPSDILPRELLAINVSV